MTFSARTTPRTMRLERRGILYGVSVLTPEGWLVFDTPKEGFGKMSPEQWVLARLRAKDEGEDRSGGERNTETADARHGRDGLDVVLGDAAADLVTGLQRAAGHGPLQSGGCGDRHAFDFTLSHGPASSADPAPASCGPG
jgi:hypothetical protein